MTHWGCYNVTCINMLSENNERNAYDDGISSRLLQIIILLMHCIVGIIIGNFVSMHEFQI